MDNLSSNLDSNLKINPTGANAPSANTANNSINPGRAEGGSRSGGTNDLNSAGIPADLAFVSRQTSQQLHTPEVSAMSVDGSSKSKNNLNRF